MEFTFFLGKDVEKAIGAPIVFTLEWDCLEFKSLPFHLLSILYLDFLICQLVIIIIPMSYNGCEVELS